MKAELTAAKSPRAYAPRLAKKERSNDGMKRASKTARLEPCSYEDKARTNEAGQVGQLRTRQKAYEIRNLANFFYVDGVLVIA